MDCHVHMINRLSIRSRRRTRLSRNIRAADRGWMRRGWGGGGQDPPRGMRDISDYRQITAALQRKGYAEPRIRKVLGLNLLRLFDRVTASAAQGKKK